jgi:3-deoxy-7-phosphoheptulonate synthase
VAGVFVTVAAGADAERVRAELAALGAWATPLEGGARPSFYLAPSSAAIPLETLRKIPGVDSVLAPRLGWPKVAAQAGRPVVVAGVAIGPGAGPVLMAGPCSIESEGHAHEVAAQAAAAGARFLRGGAFKPRTSTYAFQGHGAPALAWLRAGADAAGLGVVTEAMSEVECARVAEVADLVQIGSRNMASYALLRAAGQTGKPILLKRGMAATVDEWLHAGEYCLASGAAGVIFCERGVRGFDEHSRNLLDLGAVALMAHVHHQPVVVDPSHAAGRRDLIGPLARAALAVGAHGLMVEIHDKPGRALSDGPQALASQALAHLWREVSP